MRDSGSKSLDSMLEDLQAWQMKDSGSRFVDPRSNNSEEC